MVDFHFWIWNSTFVVFSIVGGIVVIFGLYLLLWGKENDQAAQINPNEESIPEQKMKKQNVALDVDYQRGEP